MVSVKSLEHFIYCLATTRNTDEGSHLYVTNDELSPLLCNGVLKLSINLKDKIMMIVMATKNVSHSNV